MSAATNGRTLVVRAALFLAGCATPRSGEIAWDATAVVDEHLGATPRWRAGDAPTSEEDAHVRDLLSSPLDERGALDVALIRSRRLQALLERAVADSLAAYADAAPKDPVLDFLTRWPHGPGGPIVEARIIF